MKRKTNALETGFHLLFLGCGVLSVALVLLISVYLLLSGVPAMAKLGVGRFLFGESWSAGTGEFGIWPFILTSVYGTAGAVALGVPLGLLNAVYLAKDAPGWLASAIHTAVELLSGIPSVVYGLVGMMVLVPLIQRVFALSSGACLLTAVLVLTIMILPYIISVSEAALRAVPREYEEGSLALGATEVETWFRVSLRAARSGGRRHGVAHGSRVEGVAAVAAKNLLADEDARQHRHHQHIDVHGGGHEQGDDQAEALVGEIFIGVHPMAQQRHQTVAQVAGKQGDAA